MAAGLVTILCCSWMILARLRIFKYGYLRETGKVDMLTVESPYSGGGYPVSVRDLNEDGTINSQRNPAKSGSRVLLYGTGGSDRAAVSGRRRDSARAAGA